MNNKTQEQKKYMIANIMELIAKTGKIEREFLLSTLSIETLLSKKYLENLVKDLIITNKIIIDENDILMLKNGK